MNENIQQITHTHMDTAREQVSDKSATAMNVATTITLGPLGESTVPMVAGDEYTVADDEFEDFIYSVASSPELLHERCKVGKGSFIILRRSDEDNKYWCPVVYSAVGASTLRCQLATPLYPQDGLYPIVRTDTDRKDGISKW